MFQNKDFRKYALPILLLSFIFMYFYAGLQNDHLNVITPYLEDTYGWSATQITTPVTFGGFVAILFYLITGTAFMKVGIRKFITIIASIVTLSVIGIAFSNGNYVMYFISLFILRSVIGCLQLSGFTLCTNWFSKYRGRTLGLVTSGPPLFTATGTALLTIGVESSLGFKGTYLCVGAILLICTICYFLVVRDTPEEVGLHPDGTAVTEDSVAQEESIVISVKELMSYKESWFMTILFCVVQFGLIVYIAFYVSTLRALGADQSVYLSALTIGALCAFPMGFIIGSINDKFGCCVGAIVCVVIGSIPSIIYLTMTPTSFLPCFLIAFGSATLGGGFGSVMPSMIAHYFGRARYNSANRWLYTYFAIAASFSVYFMSHFLETGAIRTAFVIMLGLMIAALVAMILMIVTGKVRYTD